MRRMNYLLAGIVAVMTCATTLVARTQQEVPRPDLLVRLLELKGKHLVTVFVLNRGKADSRGCYVTLSGTDSSEKKWTQRYFFDPVAVGATSKKVIDISPQVAKPGTFLSAEIDSSGRVAEENETNNTRELRVPEGEVPVEVPPKPAPVPPPPPPPGPEKKPPLSPDIAAADIYFEDGRVVAVLKNVGDRDYYPKGGKIKDSFKRVVTLKRIVHVGATSYTEDLKTRHMGYARVGESFNGAYPLPKNVLGATKYTWILTIEGEDPNAKNNTFTTVQKITKID